MSKRLLVKQPCYKDGCESSDAVEIYKHENGKIDGFCYSCSRPYNSKQVEEYYDLENGNSEESTNKVVDFTEIESLEIRGWKDRGITKSICELYGVRSEMNGMTPIKRHYPVTDDGERTAYKTRVCETKDFYVTGKNKKHSDLFGQSLFPAGGKYLVITGGEEDALSVAQVLTNKQYGTTPVVSPTVGESGALEQIQANYEYVASFEKVILMFDNDKVGHKANEDVAKILKPGQAYIAKLSRKDPNEYLKNGEADALKTTFFKAERYSPIDIVTLGQMWDEFENQKDVELVPFPEEFGEINYMFGGGMGLGEITTIGALTSIGKSSVINRIVHNTIVNTKYRTGILYLESTPADIVSAMLSIHLQKNLALQNRKTLDYKKLYKEFQELVHDDRRLIAVNHQGAFTSSDELFDKVEWMVNAMDTKVVVIDPLQAAVPSNENSVLDEFMDKLLKLAVRRKVALIQVAHAKKPDTKDPHAITEYDIKGTSAINQITFNTVLLSRDKTHPDPHTRNCTRIQVPKCRRTGMTGEAGWIKYHAEKAWFESVDDPYEKKSETELGNVTSDDKPVFDQGDIHNAFEKEVG